MLAVNYFHSVLSNYFSSLKFQFNFVGRILGPRGLTAKQLEAETGCKIMVRGKGSMRDKKKVSSLKNSSLLSGKLFHRWQNFQYN